MTRALHQLFAANAGLSWRRLAAFLIATALLLHGTITESTWLYVAMAFVSFEAAQRVAALVTGQAASPPTPTTEHQP